MMNPIRHLISSLLLCCYFIACCLTVYATDEVTGQNSPIPTAETEEKLRQEYLDMLRRGNYEEILTRVPPLLENNPLPDPFLAYIQGVTLHALGDLDGAEKILAPLGDYAPPLTERPRFRHRPASMLVRNIQATRQLFPSELQVIRDGGKVRFRVYYDEWTEWTRKMISVLPGAYAVNRNLLGQDFSAVTVLLFNDWKRYSKYFCTTRRVDAPPRFQRANATLDSLCISRYNGNQQDWPDQPVAYARATVAHEMNHSLVLRMTGTYRLPRWFMEGLAVYVQTKVVPSEAARYARQVQQFVQQGGILSLDDLSYHFNESVQVFTGEDTKNADRWRHSNAYQQGYSMVQLFLNKLKPGELPHFLTDLREQRRLDEPMWGHNILNQQLTRYIGQDLEEFYTEWVNLMQQALDKS